MQESIYNIFNASAGSGKTYRLTKSYIKILLQSKKTQAFKSILALTFTNKAVDEMKVRIISTLSAFSSEKILKNPDEMFKTICEDLQVSPELLQKKAQNVLRHIINNYGAFDISTIDGFIHRIIRTFAHDIRLPVNFEVELDENHLISEAVESLLDKTGTNVYLTKVLIDFAIEKADDDKSWNISYDFNEIAKLLISENDLPYINTFKDKSIKDFIELKFQILKQIHCLKTEIITLAKQTLVLIDECGLQHNDFNRGALPKHFKSLSEGKFSISFESAWQNDLYNANDLYPKRVSQNVASIIKSIQPNLLEAFTTTKSLVFELKLKQDFLKHIVPLSVLNSIWQELKILKTEQSKILISEFNTIISKEISNQPAPFIYERLGEKYKHYFIDEFQDTSRMQWHNLIPLLDNILSSYDGSVMLVGDAKQAIYRWRGGDAEQFIDLYTTAKDPFQIKPLVLNLETNYRSSKNIINFNNSFFKFLSKNYFSAQAYSELYLNTKQNTFNDSKGYINLSFLDLQKGEDLNLLYASKVLEIITQCQKNGYKLKDICVLVRRRKEGEHIANYLSENRINITSSETLLLKNSDKVTFINTFLKFLLQPNNDSLKLEVLSFLVERYHITDKHHFFTTYLKKDVDDIFDGQEPLNVFITKEKLLQLPLYDLVETIIRAFNFNNTSDAYLQFYLDTVLTFNHKQNLDLTAFINYFEKNLEKFSAITPQNANAVQIMTIHKSKGLQFPIVIFPFAEVNIYREINPKVWFPVDKNSYNGFETLLLNYSKDVKNYGTIGKLIYDKHQSQLELDNINLLYVALTRAEEQLYIVSKRDINSKGIINQNTYAGMFISYLKENNLWTDSLLTYDFGDIKYKHSIKEDKNILNPHKFISTSKEDHNLKIVTKHGLIWNNKKNEAIDKGNLVHYILSKIKTIIDLNFVINDLLVSGDITILQKEELENLIHNVVYHSELKSYFSEDVVVYNERDIITKSGEYIRPDRLNINSKNKVTIIDYKTGNPSKSHASQLNNYETVLNQMNYSVSDKLLVYINDTINVVKV